jgi:hypothetical protein
MPGAIGQLRQQEARVDAAIAVTRIAGKARARRRSPEQNRTAEKRAPNFRLRRARSETFAGRVRQIVCERVAGRRPGLFAQEQGAGRCGAGQHQRRERRNQFHSDAVAIHRASSSRCAQP